MDDPPYTDMLSLRSQSLSRVFEELSESRKTTAGVFISPETALECTAVLACVRLLSESIAAMPTNLYRRLPGGGKEIADDQPLHEILAYQPNSWMTSFEFKELMQSWLLLWGNAYAYIKGSSRRGAVDELIPLHPSRMEVKRLENGKLRYYYRTPATIADPNPSPEEYRQEDIFHLRWMSSDGVTGYVATSLSKDAIALARATELHSSAFFGNGASVGTYIETDQPHKPDALQRFRQQWDEAHRGPDKAFKTVVMPFGFKKKSEPVNNSEAELVATRRFQLEEVCRAFRVPPHLVGDLSNVRYSTVEQAAIDYKTFSIMPWCRRWELACRRDLVVDDKTYFVGFDMNSLMAGDYAARSTYLREAFNTGALDVDEYRAEIGYNPLPDGLGKKRFVQVNMQLLDAFTLETPNGQPAQAPPTSLPAEEQPQEQPGGDEPPAEAEAERSVDAAEALFRTTLRRIAAIEAEGILSRRAKADKITQWFGQVEEKLRTELLDAANATGRDIDSFVVSWLERSKDLLLDCHRSGKQYETVTNRWFEAHFDEVEDGNGRN
jgi:HK97 family phage portal protein